MIFKLGIVSWNPPRLGTTYDGFGVYQFTKLQSYRLGLGINAALQIPAYSGH